MLPFESELKEFKRGVEDIKEELEESIEIDRNATIRGSYDSHSSKRPVNAANRSR